MLCHVSSHSIGFGAGSGAGSAGSSGAGFKWRLALLSAGASLRNLLQNSEPAWERTPEWLPQRSGTSATSDRFAHFHKLNSQMLPLKQQIHAQLLGFFLGFNVFFEQRCAEFRPFSLGLRESGKLWKRLAILTCFPCRTL